MKQASRDSSPDTDPAKRFCLSWDPLDPDVALEMSYPRVQSNDQPGATDADDSAPESTVELLLRTLMLESTAMVQMMLVRAEKDRVDDINTHFSKYIGELLKDIKPLHKRLACQLKIMETVHSYLDDDDD